MRDEIARTLREFFRAGGTDVVCAYLYGSVGRDEAGPRSDVDVAVLYRESPPATIDGMGLDLAAALERHLGRRVDLVVLNRAAPDLVHRVLRDGMLVHDGDPRLRICFEVKLRAEYLDLLPYLRRYRRSVGGAAR